MFPVTVSVSDFRANMMSLYRQYISPNNAISRPIEVMDMKRGKKLFVVQPAAEREADHEYLEGYIKKLKALRKNIEFDEARLNSFKKDFDKNMKDRLVFSHGYSD